MTEQAGWLWQAARSTAKGSQEEYDKPQEIIKEYKNNIRPMEIVQVYGFCERKVRQEPPAVIG